MGKFCVWPANSRANDKKPDSSLALLAVIGPGKLIEDSPQSVSLRGPHYANLAGVQFDQRDQWFVAAAPRPHREFLTLKLGGPHESWVVSNHSTTVFVKHWPRIRVIVFLVPAHLCHMVYITLTKISGWSVGPLTFETGWPVWNLGGQ